MDNCQICGEYIAAFGLTGQGPPTALHLDAGQPNDDDAGATDADAPTPGRSPRSRTRAAGGAAADRGLRYAGHGGSPGDATLVDTSDPNNGQGGPTQRTVVVSAAPGIYHHICAFHPWMQGTIRVVGGEGDGP